MLDWLFYADQIIMKNSGETASVAIRTSVELKRYTEGNSLRIRSEMLKACTEKDADLDESHGNL